MSWTAPGSLAKHSGLTQFLVLVGLDFVRVDSESGDFHSTFFAVRFGGGGVAVAVVGMTIGFGLEGLIFGMAGEV